MTSNKKKLSPLGIRIPRNYIVKHDIGMHIVRMLLRLVSDVNPHRPQGCLIISKPNNGKTFLLKLAMKMIAEAASKGTGSEPEHQGASETGGGPKTTCQVDEKPVLYMRAPVKANHKNLLRDMGAKLGIRFADRCTIGSMQSMVRRGLIMTKTKAVFVDELQHLVSGGGVGTRVILDDIKVMSDDLGIPFIMAGTQRALQVISADDQYLSRFRPFDLPVWKYDNDFLGLVRDFELRMKVAKGTFLSASASREVFIRSRGIIGGIVEIMNESLRLAEEEGAQRISLGHIRRCGYHEMVNNQQDNRRKP